MEREDAEGAAAAAEYFIELYPYVMATGDTEEFEAMSHRACGFCEQALRDADRIQARDQTFQGGRTEVDVLNKYLRDDLTGVYPLDVEVRQAASKTLDSAGSVVAAARSQTSEHRVEVGRKNDRWVVVAIAPRPEP
jgi:pilus assembly protein TadC